MIYRLRRKFIWICTLSFLGVFLALLAGIYLTTYFQAAGALDDLADIVSENQGRFPDFEAPGPQEDPRPAERDPEAPFTTRFFTVFFHGDGGVETDVGSIASVSQEEAAALGQEALGENRERGWVGEYRYKVWQNGDEGAIRQLVSILLDNAVKYCDPQGSIRVELLGKRRPVLTVDNSCQNVDGLPLPRLFDRFYRADAARTYGGGFGVGLSIAKGIAERHGGDIAAVQPGAGVIRFRVKL